MWKNFHLSFPGTSFSSLTGETCMVQASTCLFEMLREIRRHTHTIQVLVNLFVIIKS